MAQNRKIEFQFDQYKINGDVLSNYHPVFKDVDTGDFYDVLEKINIRLLNEWADGNTILFLTEKQHAKLINLLKEKGYEYFGR